MSLLNEMRDEFTDPSAEHRSVLFWSWNDDLDPEEISRQIVDMKEKGLGGFFYRSGQLNNITARKRLDLVN